MSINLRECQTNALKLSLKDRAILAERLITSLDKPDESENEQLWVAEAEHRYKEYRKGRIKARSARDVLRDTRSAMQ